MDKHLSKFEDRVVEKGGFPSRNCVCVCAHKHTCAYCKNQVMLKINMKWMSKKFKGLDKF